MYLETAKYLKNGISVFILNDCDAVAAKSLREAVDWYEKETGCTQDDDEVYPDIEIKRQDMNSLIFIDEDRKIKGTVKSQIDQTNKFPCLIWSTEF